MGCRRTMRWLVHGVVAWAACTTVAVAAQQQSPAPSAAEKSKFTTVSEWSRANRVQLGVTQPALGFAARWRFERATTGDIYLEREESRAGKLESGTLLLLGEGALLARDARLEAGKELDAVNGPLLMLQLVLQLLQRSVPGGPAALAKDVKVEVSDAVRSIAVSGVGADGEFHAPWRVAGTIGPGGAGIVKFELEFSSSVRGRPGVRYETSIAGIWENTTPPVVFQDTMPLRGWQVYRIKPAVRARGSINTLGLGTSGPLGFPNLGEVRKRTVQWADEQAKRSKWQCN